MCLHAVVEFPPKCEQSHSFASFACSTLQKVATACHCWTWPFVTSQRALVCHWYLYQVRDLTHSQGVHSALHTDALLFSPSKYVEGPTKRQLYVPASVLEEAVNRAKYALRLLRHWTLQWQNRAKRVSMILNQYCQTLKASWWCHLVCTVSEKHVWLEVQPISKKN